MNGGAGYFTRPLRGWRDMVTVYDLPRTINGVTRPRSMSNGAPAAPRPFLALTLHEQAFVVARIAWIMLDADRNELDPGSR